VSGWRVWLAGLAGGVSLRLRPGSRPLRPGRL